MRRLPLLLVAALAALAALAAIPSHALADPPADGGQASDPCPPPELTHNYDTTTLTVHAAGQRLSRPGTPPLHLVGLHVPGRPGERGRPRPGRGLRPVPLGVGHGPG